MAGAVGFQSSSRKLSPRILLMVPHPDTAELYEWALHDAGFAVCRVPIDGTHQAGFRPDAAVVYMRHADGAYLRKMLPGRRVPTILLTGWLSQGTAPRDIDCDALLRIPVDPTTLVKKVQELLYPA